MQSYSQDLRDRVLRALARGEGPSAIARRFEVSRFYVYQVRDREQETGVRNSFPIGGHRRSRLEEAEPALRGWIAAEPGLTLAELQERLASQGDCDQDRRSLASVEQVESDLQKKRCTPASKSARTCRQRGAHGVKRSRRWTSKSWYLSMKPGPRPT